MALTRRQREALDVIRDFISRNGYSPSLEEIGKALNLSSVATVHKHVTHLVAKGFARRVWNQNRSIELTGGPDALAPASVPVAGLLAAGAPIVTVPDGGTTMIPADLAPEGRKLHALRVAGDSLLPAGMRDGDLVVVEERADAGDGETVVAILGGGGAVVATMRREGDRSWLEGAEDKAMPLSPGRAEVRGVLLGLVRRYGKP
jgi:repressor LexA